MAAYLRQIIKNVEPLLATTCHQICDTNLKFKYVGQQFAQFLGLAKKDIIDKNLAHLNCPLQQSAARYFKLNRQVVEDKVTAHYATVAYLDQEIYVFKSYARPILHKTNSIGVFLETTYSKNSLTDFGLDMFSLIAKQNIIIYNYNRQPNTKPISDLEELIIFFIAIGQTDKEIAHNLSFIKIYMTTHAVSKIISRKLYPKLNVSSKNQLINKIFTQGLQHKLPRLLIDNPILFKVIGSVNKQ